MDNKKNNNVERTEMPQKQIKKAHLPRVVAVDFGRGFGMFIILTLHLFIFWGFNSGGLVTSQNYGAQPIWARLVSVPFQFLGSWASIFALLTGVSSTYI